MLSKKVATHSFALATPSPFNTSPKALNNPIFVIQEPTNTSSIFLGLESSAKISDNVATSSGSFGQAKIGSLISSRLILKSQF